MCRSGFREVVGPHGLCSCEKRASPQCPSGFTLNRASCQCTIDIPPTCPRGSSLSPLSARCTGSDDPTCPRDATLYEPSCQCVTEFVRECKSGELSWDGCKCTSTSTPTCSSGCRLNSNGRCTCDRISK